MQRVPNSCTKAKEDKGEFTFILGQITPANCEYPMWGRGAMASAPQWH